MGFSNIISLLTGVALFLFGMLLMGEGLKKVAGNKLERILYKLTGNPLKGMLFGAGVTTFIQSSSATSVMMIGFVNTNLMKVRQAIPVILGAILGTSITGWVICLSMLEGAGGIAALFSTSTLTGVTALVGIFLKMFSSKLHKNRIGEVLLGFSVLMVGMSTMSGSVSVLKESPQFTTLITKVSNPLLGIIIGVVFTCVLQSASAAVGILQALTVTGSIQFGNAVPLIMGISIGAAVPVLLSAITSTKEGKQTSLAYLTSNLAGVIILAPIYYVIVHLSNVIPTDYSLGMVDIALINTIYRLVVVIILLPMYKWIARLSELIIPNEIENKKQEIMILPDERLLSRPSLALEQTKNAICDMAGKAVENYKVSLKMLEEYSEDSVDKIMEQEDIIDSYEDKLTNYLMKLNLAELDDVQNKVISKQLHVLTDFERIGDHGVNITQYARELNEKNIEISKEAMQDLKVIERAVDEIVNLAHQAFVNDDLNMAVSIEPLEEVIDSLCDVAKLHHIDRLRKGVCTYESAFAYNDMLISYERVADHCSNIALALISVRDNVFEPHAYSHDIKVKNKDFDEKYNEYKAKYQL